MKKFILILATGFGSGYVPKMPGTAGSVLGLFLFYFLKDLSVGAYFITLFAFMMLSVWVSTGAEVLLGEKDASLIVIDEIVGIFVTLTLVSFSWKNFILGFILFRVFDIGKPFPVKLIQDKFPAGWGVVGDDVMAGIYANLVLRLFIFLWGMV